MLNVICDLSDVVVDIASEEANLSRGYQLPRFKEYLGLPDMDIAIGDTFDGVTVTPNKKVRDYDRKLALQNHLIDLHVRHDKAVEIGLTEPASWIATEIYQCEQELATLSS